jgi:hypothetical protein
LIAKAFRDNYLFKIEAIQVHDLVPGGDEVMHKLLLRVVAGINFGDGAELGIGTEDQVDGGAGPFDVAAGAIAALEEEPTSTKRKRVVSRSHDHSLSHHACIPNSNYSFPTTENHESR